MWFWRACGTCFCNALAERQVFRYALRGRGPIPESAMIIVWGTKLYGKVDEVPGMFHVATRFFHLWYIPLVPLSSAVTMIVAASSVRR